MQTQWKLWSLVCCAFVVACPIAQAVVVHQGSLDRPPGGYVGLMSGSSAIPIGRYYVLTAKHVNTPVGDLFFMNDSSAPSGGVPSYVQTTYSHATADLKIVKLDRPIPYFSQIYEGTVVAETSVQVGGWGYGAGTPIADGYLWDYVLEERWGINNIYLSINPPSNLLRVKFHASAHSAVPARQDSGGGFFVQENGTWKLAGIITTATGGGQSRFEWDYGAAVPMKPYLSWIRSIVPKECAGDANGDHRVTGADLSVLLSNFGQTVQAFTSADFNGDWLINGADLAVLLANFGCP